MKLSNQLSIRNKQPSYALARVPLGKIKYVICGTNPATCSKQRGGHPTTPPPNHFRCAPDLKIRQCRTDLDFSMFLGFRPRNPALWQGQHPLKPSSLKDGSHGAHSRNPLSPRRPARRQRRHSTPRSPVRANRAPLRRQILRRLPQWRQPRAQFDLKQYSTMETVTRIIPAGRWSCKG